MSDTGSEGDLLDALAEEFVERRRGGEACTPIEYARRYPEHARSILDLFPALEQLENLKPAGIEEVGVTAGAPMGPDGPPREELGDYRIIRRVGRGGMGIVYEAEQISLGRRVALKMLPRSALLSPSQVERFRREARAAARLHHTNIVPVFGIGECDGLHFYVMQFIDGPALDDVMHELRRLRDRSKPAATPGGGDPIQATGYDPTTAASALARRLEQPWGQPGPSSGQTVHPATGESSDATQAGTGETTWIRPVEGLAPAPIERLGPAPIEHPAAALPARRRRRRRRRRPDGDSSLGSSGRERFQNIARIGLKVAEALAHAAGQGILHRDIKPSNLLLDLDGTIWVTDFGLAKALDDDASLTETGDVIGTLRYMAPERLRGQGDIRSDICSLGLTIYELLVLRPAYPESDRHKLVTEILEREPVPPRSIDPTIPRHDPNLTAGDRRSGDPAGPPPARGGRADDARRRPRAAPHRTDPQGAVDVEPGDPGGPGGGRPVVPCAASRRLRDGRQPGDTKPVRDRAAGAGRARRRPVDAGDRRRSERPRRVYPPLRRLARRSRLPDADPRRRPRPGALRRPVHGAGRHSPRSDARRRAKDARSRAARPVCREPRRRDPQRGRLGPAPLGD